MGVQFSYFVEGQYLAISKHGLYVAIPTKHDITICMATEGYLSMLYQALYLVDTLEWRAYASYISERNRINKHCLVDSKVWHANLVVNLDGYLWVVHSLVNENIQI